MKTNDNNYRFNIQINGDSEQASLAGELLENAGNKKGKLIVAAITYYIQNCPDALDKNTGTLKVKFEELLSKSEVQAMVKQAIQEQLQGLIIQKPVTAETGIAESDASDEIADEFLAHLSIFEETT